MSFDRRRAPRGQVGASWLLGLSLLLVALAACGQKDPVSGGDGDADDEPPETDGDAGAGMDDAGPSRPAPSGSLADDFYPLVAGANWVYHHTGGSMPWDEEIDVEEVEHDGSAAFQTSDTAGPGGARSVSVLVDDGARVVRVHKDVFEADMLTSQVDYDPGFARFDRSWLELDEGDSETLSYTRTAVDPAGTLMAMGERTHVYTVADVDAEVSVPAGSFDGCIEIQRERVRAATEPAGEGDSKRFWYCAGVGKVKELDQTAGKIEELVSCEIPGGGCP